MPEHPRNVSFCPADDKSDESSPMAEDRTANFLSDQSPFEKTVSSSLKIDVETESLNWLLEIPATALKSREKKMKKIAIKLKSFLAGV